METRVNTETKKETIQHLDTVEHTSKLKILQDVEPTDFKYDAEPSSAIDKEEPDRNPVKLFSRNKWQLKVFDSSVQSKQSIAAVKPVIRTENADSESHKMKDRQPFAERRHMRQPDWKFKDEISLPCIKIDLLVLSRFNVKHDTENTKITFDKNKNKVTFETMAYDELKDLRLKLYECLDSAVCEVKTLSEQRYQLLSRTDCLASLQSKIAELENIRVIYQCSTHRKAIRCHAFSEREALRGIQLLEDEITQLKINVKPAQTECLKNTTWIALKKSLDVYLTSVSVADTGETIVVESLVEQEATTTYNAILRYLKDNIKMKTVSVILATGKAKCFQTRFENKLRHEMQTKGGTLNIVTLTEDPLKLQVSAEGVESITGELNRAVDQIWQENINISDISPQANDVWLITNGLQNLTGKEFLLRFEQTYTCFIDVSVNDENSEWYAWDTMDDDELVCQDAEAVVTTHIPDEPEYSEKTECNNQSGENPKGVKFRQYQAGISEEEALQLALLRSAESSNVEEHNIIDTGNVRPKRHSNVDVTADSTYSPGTCAEVLQSGHRAVYTFKYLEDDNRTVYFSECTSVCETHPLSSTFNVAPQTESEGSSEQQPDTFLPEVKSRNMYMFKTKVKLIQGQIVQQHADALVNVMSSTENPFDGTIPKSFLEEGGQILLQMYECVESSCTGTVVVTSSSGQLQHKCSTIFHVKMNNVIPLKTMVSRAVSEIFAECANWNCKSVAIPPLGVDSVRRYPPAGVAEAMLTEIGHQLQGGLSNIKQVLLVVNDDVTYTVFDKAVQTFKQSSVYDNQQTFKQKPNEVSSKNDKTSRMSAGSHISEYQSFASASTGRSRFSKYKPTIVLCGNGSSSVSKRNAFREHDRRSDNAVSYHRRGRSTNRHRGKERSDTTRRLKRRSRGLSPETDALDTRAVFDGEAQDNFDPAPSLNVTITAENKDICGKARDAFEKRVKEEFLHEEIVEKNPSLTDKSRHIIEKIVSTHEIKSVEGNDYYILRGHEGTVRKACIEIRKVIIEEKNSSILEEKAKRSRGAERDTYEFIKAKMDSEPEVPTYWKNYKQGKSLSSLLVSAKHFVTRNKFEQVELGKGRHAFSSIIKMINATFDSSLVGQGSDAQGLDGFEYKKLFVLKIERIENLDLYDQFSRKRQAFYRRLYKSGDLRFPKIEDIPKCSGSIATASHIHPALDGDIQSEINEYLLFHGTKEENVTTICNDGLDPRISSGNSMFGPGIYAAECATKADQYADDKSRRSAGRGKIKKMFLIRMVLGNSYLCTKKSPNKFRRPPCTTCVKDDCKNAGHAGKFGHAYDSVVGDNNKLFREFIVYDSSLCYPEYLITYERR